MKPFFVTRENRTLSKDKSGPLYYFANCNLMLPTQSGEMVVDRSLLSENFEFILGNHQGKKFKRCIDPFSGCASWSLAAMELELAEEYIINDSDEALINTLRLMKEDPARVKLEYRLLVNEYTQSGSKKEFFLRIIDTYNQAASLDEKSLLLSFIINHSWGGVIYHDDKSNLVYRNAYTSKGMTQGYLDTAFISVENYSEEVDRTSNLLNINTVILKSGDFLEALSDIQEGDFVAMNPPYPETSRANSVNTVIYTELYSKEVLHTNLLNMIRKMENNNIEYYLAYGCHDPEMKKFLIRDESDQLKHFFRILSDENCAFGIGLDQIYFTSKYSIPKNLYSKIMPAVDVLQGQELTAVEALANFRKKAQEIEALLTISDITQDDPGSIKNSMDIPDYMVRNEHVDILNSEVNKEIDASSAQISKSQLSDEQKQAFKKAKNLFSEAENIFNINMPEASSEKYIVAKRQLLLFEDINPGKRREKIDTIVSLIDKKLAQIGFSSSP